MSPHHREKHRHHSKKSSHHRETLHDLAKKVHELFEDEPLKQVYIEPDDAETNQYPTNATRDHLFQATESGSYGQQLNYTLPFYTLCNPLRKNTDTSGDVIATSIYTRLADKVRFTSTKISGRLFIDDGDYTSKGGDEFNVRFMLVRMREPRGAPMVLFESAIDAGTTPPLFFTYPTTGYPYPWSLTDHGIGSNAYENYKIIYDKVHRYSTGVPTTETGGTSHQGARSWEFRIHKKLRFHSDYSISNYGNISDMQTNALYFVMLTDYAGNGLQVQYDQRTFFKDA